MLPLRVDEATEGEAGLFVDLLPLLVELVLVDELPLVELDVRESFWLSSCLLCCEDADGCELAGGGLEASLDDE